MIFFRAFATVVFWFGFSANIPGFVNGLAIANPRSLVSTGATIGSDIIMERHLNDDAREDDIAVIIPRIAVSPSITSGPRPPPPRQPGGGKNGNHGGDGDVPDPGETGDQPDSVEVGDGTGEMPPSTPDADGPDKCKEENLSKKQKARCQHQNPPRQSA